jgi:HD-GYP domain-containing protein (c-di-GMP phosphodiesterase class II)
MPGHAIPLLVRVLSVADVYDALASARPYRDAMPPAQCQELLRSNAAGGGLDPHLVEYFCEAMAEPGPGPVVDAAAPAPASSLGGRGAVSALVKLQQ